MASLTYDVIVSGVTITNPSYVEVYDSINDKYQSAKIQYKDNTPIPSINDTINININDTNVFSGYVSRRGQDIKGTTVWDLQCVGKTYDLWRNKVDGTGTYSFTGYKTGYIVSSLVADYTNLTFPQSDDLGETLNGEWDLSDMVVGDAITKINAFDDYYFYVNSGNELIYYKTGASQMTIEESDIVYRKKFEYSDDEIYNDILVRGYDVTGCAYNQTSIDAYGRHLLEYSEAMIDNQSDADTLASALLAEYKDPKLCGSITIQGDESISISDSFTLDLTNLSISTDDTIVGYKHVLDDRGFTTKIDFGRVPYDPAKEFNFMRRSNSNTKYGMYKAIVDVAAAEAAVDGKVTSFYQTTEPTGGESSEGDLWFDTDDDNKVYYYSNSSWVVAQDGGIAAALASSLAAHASAMAAIASANNAMTSANAALVLADGKVATFYQTTYPTYASEGAVYGDFWYDSDDERLWICSVAEPDSEDDWVTTGEFSAAWDDITGSNKPQDYATKNKTYYGTNPPNGVGEGTGDIWISSNGRPFIMSGSNWYATTWAHVKEDPDAPSDNATKNELIRQSTQPNAGSYSAGDMWVDSDNGRPHIHDGVGWQETTWDNIKNFGDCENPGDYTADNEQSHDGWLTGLHGGNHHQASVESDSTAERNLVSAEDNNGTYHHEFFYVDAINYDRWVGAYLYGLDPDATYEGWAMISITFSSASAGEVLAARQVVNINEGPSAYRSCYCSSIIPGGCKWKLDAWWDNDGDTDDDSDSRVYSVNFTLDTPD